MKILKESIRDISSDFVDLEKLLEDADYVVSIYSRTFEYISDSKHFNIENLKDIFNENSIDGDLNVILWDSAYEKISKHLRYATYFHGVDKDSISSFKIVSDNTLLKRMSLFENMIKKYIMIPPEISIEHIPVRPSYFGSFIIWGLSFIFLNEGTGIVICFETSD